MPTGQLNAIMETVSNTTLRLTRGSNEYYVLEEEIEVEVHTTDIGDELLKKYVLDDAFSRRRKEVEKEINELFSILAELFPEIHYTYNATIIQEGFNYEEKLFSRILHYSLYAGIKEKLLSHYFSTIQEVQRNTFITHEKLLVFIEIYETQQNSRKNIGNITIEIVVRKVELF